MKRQWLDRLIFIVVVPFLIYLTYERNKVWKDDVMLWANVAEKAPDNALFLFKEKKYLA